MIDIHELKKRDLYLNKIIAFQDTEPVKVAPLKKINDNYEKIVLSMNTGMDSSYDGIKSINLIDWLIA